MVRHHGAVFVVGTVAVVVGAVIKGLMVTPPVHDPPAPALRLVLSMVWVVAQAVSLAVAVVGDDWRFTKTLAAAGTLGILVMAVGRSGMSAIWSGGFVGMEVLVFLLAIGAGVWCVSRPLRAASGGTLWRLFFWMAVVGGVYLYSALPLEAAGHFVALGVVLSACGLLGLWRPALFRFFHGLESAIPTRLSTAAWALTLALLVLNAWWVRSSGASVPQMRIGPATAAPYYLAVFTAVIALVIDARARAAAAWRGWVWPIVAMGLVSGLYVVALHEPGTLAILVLSVMVAMLIAGTPMQAVTAVGSILFGAILLRTSTVVTAIETYAPRPGERLAVWAGRSAPPDQLVRVLEVASLAGVLGHVGAARLQFLVGAQVGKDYMPALILANGGWLGLGLAGAASLLFVAGLYRISRVIRGHVCRALPVSVCAVLVGNFLVTTLWMGGVTPFVGVPLPLFARAGSHLLVLAVVLILVDAASTPVETEQRRYPRAA